MLAEPPLCRLKDLEDGTYSIDDLANFHEVLDLRAEIVRRATNKPGKL